MRISDWSSDVCSSDLDRIGARAAGKLPQPARAVQIPIAPLGGRAIAIGRLNVTADVDGAVRYEPLVVQYYDELYPSLSMTLAATALNLKPADIQVRLGEALGSAHVLTPVTNAAIVCRVQLDKE